MYFKLDILIYESIKQSIIITIKQKISHSDLKLTSSKLVKVSVIEFIQTVKTEIHFQQQIRIFYIPTLNLYQPTTHKHMNEVIKKNILLPVVFFNRTLKFTIVRNVLNPVYN